MKLIRTFVSFATLSTLGSLALACGGGADETPPPQPPPQPTVTAPPPDPTPPPPPPVEAPKPALSDLETTAVKGMFDAMSAHDAAKTTSFYTDDAVFRAAGMPDAHGKDDFAKELTREFAAAPDGKYTAGRIILKDDVAIVEWSFTGTNTGPLMPGMKPSGKPMGFQGVAINWFTPEGKVKEQHNYFDFATMLRQVGLMKGKSRPIPTPGNGDVVLAKGTPDEDAAIAMTKKADEIRSKKDLPTLLTLTTLCTDDVVLDDTTDLGPLVGTAAMKKALTAGFKQTSAFTVAASGMWAAGSVVVQEITETITIKGKDETRHVVEVVDLRDGKAAHLMDYSSSMENTPMGPPAGASGGAKKDGAKPGKTTAAKHP